MAGPVIAAAIAAVAALAVAAGEGMSATAATQEGRKNRRQQLKWHDEDLVQQKTENDMARQRLAMEQSQANQQKPMNTLNFISGLEDLKQKRMRSGGYLETVRGLAGR